MSGTLFDVGDFANLTIARRLNDSESREKLRSCEICEFDDGDEIIRKGEQDDAVYLLLSGRVSIHLTSNADSPIAHASAGELIGELAFIDGKSRSAIVVSRAKTRTLRLEKKLVASCEKLNQVINDHLLMTLAQRTRKELHVLSDEREFLKIKVTELQEAKDMFRKAFRTSPNPMLLTKFTDGEIIEVNESFLNVTGHERDAVIGRTSAELTLWADPNDRSEILKKLEREEYIRDWEVNLRTKTGEIRVGQISSECVEINGEKFIISGISDVTDQRRTEEALIQAKEKAERAKKQAEEAYQAIVQFLANMSHEIRTPLNAILGYAQILTGDPAATDSQQEKLQKIESAGDHLLNLVNDFVDWYKIQADAAVIHEKAFNLSELLQGIQGLFEHRLMTQALIWNVSNECGGNFRVIGDQGKLRQILINLIGNAAKFTESGNITLRAKKKPNARCFFEVIDTGKGIPYDKRSEIFEPYKQIDESWKKGGTGLGLAISKKYVELMGGKISVKDNAEDGRGSCFFFDVHLPPAKSQTVTRTPRDLKVIHLKPEISISAFVVDDDRASRNILSHALRVVGIDVSEAKDGREALRMLEERIPDIVFLDLRMPEMSGLEAMQQIREKFAQIPLKCVAVSGTHAFGEPKEFYIKKGFNDFVSKPYRFEAIYECIDKLFDEPFVYEPQNMPHESHTIEKIKLDSIQIPSSLLRKLRSAAKLARKSQVDTNLTEIERILPDGKKLALHLRPYAKNWDWQGLLAQLKEVRPCDQSE